MYVWGSTVHGELGLGGIEDEHILAPRPLEWFGANNIQEAACGDSHSLLLTKEGKVYSCGNNDYGQLGHEQPRKRPHQVLALDAYRISHVACGQSHSMALNEWGQIFTWGSDIHGQLGHQLGQQTQPVPKILKALATLHVVQIACGHKHSIALTSGKFVVVRFLITGKREMYLYVTQYKSRYKCSEG
ncbi:probable E3 ubiquitin-protein ligase HERC4 isoform X2 [Photinus pyralis]|uniref:probable E3 ubiquitin-protein ligase HERC4 isoform X2 n=1 Tax=Photinus pyralis TaxID=7054 RepID=UPI001267162D|nr:probable E3 ubiquitin-protein ligase HERC4 isoform X2 [Photinus pyralis]